MKAMQSLKPVGRRYLFNLVMAACVVLFSLMSIFGFIAIQNKNQFIGTQYNGATWSAASLEIEYLQFLHEIGEFLQERSDKDSMLLQFDILWSRVPIMIDGSEVDVLQDLPGYAENLSAIEQALARVDPVVQKLNPGDQADIRFVQSELLKIRETVHAVLMSTYHAWSNTLTTNQDKIKGLRYLLYASFAGILLSSFGLIRVLARQVRFGRDLLAENNLALDEVKLQKLVLEQEMEQRQQAVAALRDSENRFKDVADIAADWFWELDDQLRFSYLSERYQEITGVDPSKVIGRGPSDFPNWQEQNEGTFERQVDSMNNRQAINDVEMSFTAGDGSERKISISGRPLFANDGGFLGYRGVGRDITGRVKVEQELMAAKTIAEEANASKSRFLAAASHDLRQPLQTLRLLNSALGQSHKKSDIKSIVGKQAAALESMDRMLDVLLDLNRLESGLVYPEQRDFALATLLRRLESDFRESVNIKGLAFRIVYCDVWITSDPELLYTMLHNLISNAVKYTVSGGVLIGCRKRGEQLSIEIWDTGLGIPGDGQSLIFEEFYQLGNPARDQRKGYGLGLAIVKRLGNLLNHEVAVRSRVGKGSVFSVLVPRGVKNIVVESTESATQATVDSIVPAKILCIEDDPAVLESLNILLKMQGYSILSATNGQTALNLLREDSNDPDIIITDYRLPGGELGTSVVREINAVLDRAVPTIVITGDTAQIELRSDQAPGWRILHKPVKGEQLIRVIQELSPDQKDPKRSKFPLPHIVNA